MEYVPGKIDDMEMFCFLIWLVLTPVIFLMCYIILAVYAGKYSPHHALLSTWDELVYAWDELDDDDMYHKDYKGDCDE